MKLAWIMFGSVMSFLVIFAFWQKNNIQHENLTSAVPAHADTTLAETNNHDGKEALISTNISTVYPTKEPAAFTGTLPKGILPDSIVAYGLKLKGAPYLVAGITDKGFDCSGFIHHIFKKYGVELPHSSALLVKEGAAINLDEVKKGDLLIFTGTTVTDRTPGHVGVVITEKGQAIEFVHASSEGGVKISKVAGTGYQNRFLEARRVL